MNIISASKSVALMVLMLTLSLPKSHAVAQNPDSELTGQKHLKIYTETFPPYNYINDGKLQGINVEFVQAMCELANIQCEFTLYPWNRSFRAAQNNKNSGLISAARTKERRELFSWIGPVSSGQSCIFKLSSRDDIQIKDQASLSQYTMGTARDNAYEKILEALGFTRTKNLILFPTKNGDVRPFAAQRVDFIIGSALTIEHQLTQAELALHEVTPVHVIDKQLLNGNFLALNLETDSSIVTALQRSYETLTEQNMLSTIEAKYIRPIQPEQKGILNNLDIWEECAKSIR
ncbi:transporter substrate-binding domain-containing protein [Glaciecola sp. XM2]|uniref:substrate-binding periplasmic protein n=1 Tax=Glaciecola sp. XM2 TaxID=1914931 RepID=UPI001BDE9344|nr:transporter substrate-binding domain-containing protein [Glaciecola sp. XM2]